MHFVGSVHQALRSNTCVPARQRRVVAIAQCTVQLDRRVDNLVYHVRQEHLGDAILLAQVHPFLCLVGDVQQHQPGLVNLCRAVGHHPPHALAISQTLTESFALGDVGGSQIECALGHGDVVHAMSQAAISQSVLAHVEALASTAEDVFAWHSEVLDSDLGMRATQFKTQVRMRLHGLDIAQDLVARIREFHNERRILLVSWCVGVCFCHDDGNVSNTGGRTEPLLTVQHPFVAIEFGLGLHASGIGTCRFLCH